MTSEEWYNQTMKLPTQLINALRGGPFLLLVLPSSANYKLQSSSFGSGSGTATSANYAENGQAGQTAGVSEASTTYMNGPSVTFTRQADVPPAPTFTNPNSYYNRLQLTLNVGPNATDATYAVAVSSDGFATTLYLRADGTLGATITAANFQTYALWGGGAGTSIIGLNPHTTYAAKVSAMHGKYTATGFGPAASATTLDPSISFSLATSTQPSPPFSISFGSLTPSTVISSPQNVFVTLQTNGQQGANVYLLGQNTGLKSMTDSYTIASASTNLSVATEGFGAQSVTATQTTGGPLTAVAPFAGSAANVGAISNVPAIIYSSTAPVTGGSASFGFKAKSGLSDPAANDYQEIVTATASSNF